MVRAHSLLPIAVALIAVPAHAREAAVKVDVSAGRLDEAVRVLGRQSGASIGFRDTGLGGTRVRAVRGTMTAHRALGEMLRKTALRARKVAPNTFLIEAGPPAPRPASRPASSPPRAREPAAAPMPPPREIVVTGTKRDVPLGAYPGGVQIVDGGELSTADAARGSGAIATRLASVVSTHLGPGRNKLFIRGIADSSFVGPTQATVGQYWGNSRITYSAPDPSLRLYDVRSIEVLEGPQGTLYGAGSLGGVVRVVPHSPDLDSVGGSAWGGVQAVKSGQPGVDGGGILNLPIVEDRLGFRALAFGSIEGGYINDTGRDLKNVNDVKTIGGRAALRFDPGDGWMADLNAVGQRIDGDDSQYAARGRDGLSRSSTIAQPYRNDFWLADLVVRKAWDQLELTSSLGYTRQYVFEQFEGAELSEPFNPAKSPLADAAPVEFSQKNHIEMVTAETRLARRGRNGRGWLIGASFLHNEARVNREMIATYYGSPLTGVRNRVEELTIYGEGTVEPVPRLTVTMGGRFTHSRLTGDSEDVGYDLALSADPLARDARKETRFLPSAAVAYRPMDELTLFARYQQGFRPGGISVRREFIQRFKGDRVSTYEGGARYLDANFEMEGTASYSRWRNIQADLIDGFGFPTTVNVGDGRVLSLGLSSRWRPLAGLELDAAVYLNDSKVSQPSELALTISRETLVSLSAMADNAADVSASDFERLPNIADVSARFGISYQHALTDTLDFDARGYLRYVGKSTLGVGPILGQLQGDYVDTGLEFRLGNRARGLSLAFFNLFDGRGNRFALGSPFLVRDRNQITPLQPRTVRLGFDLSF
ncbi:TonB-dependent receptor [Tsuneonella sp. CC-YZS046]|uniref:TonB-dependent receptor n=1 Tax=Tsuneonella sp. CC-YZS046 TaxID=3042152 RepID=UPI002D78F5F1|nr:TonB-dependent receptor [Tsuneonella sp. CC-YZS046]WRO65579.1 TonB-dependent receptor [Tsuneonella sp. CC-YZS046]